MGYHTSHARTVRPCTHTPEQCPFDRCEQSGAKAKGPHRLKHHGQCLKFVNVLAPGPTASPGSWSARSTSDPQRRETREGVRFCRLHRVTSVGLLCNGQAISMQPIKLCKANNLSDVMTEPQQPTNIRMPQIRSFRSLPHSDAIMREELPC